MDANINVNSAATMETENLPRLPSSQDFSTYCLNILGIGIQTKLGKLISDAVLSPRVRAVKSGQWLEVIRTIAEVCADRDRYVFTQSQLYDFLTLATKQMGVEAGKRFRLTELVFKIYKDIMEDYLRSDDSLKYQYPMIIVDIVSVLLRGKDTTGREISPHALEKYFEERKAQFRSNQPYQLSEDPKLDQNLVENLSQITGRERSSLILLLGKLDRTDVDKLTDLCVNYDKLQKYIALMDSEGEFRKEVENEIGRKLTYNQFQHASVSIRKARSYIENVLDGKFLPHGSHGINHVRHNLEYGYQVIGIIERKRRAYPKAR